MKRPYDPNLATLPASAGANADLLKALTSCTDALVSWGSQRYSRFGLWFDTRYSLWSGQNDAGTKELEDAFPWPGASDTRVRLADKIIKERVRLRKAGFWGKRLKANALRGTNTGAATFVNTLLKWQLYTQAIAMVQRETALAWNYADTYGSAIMGCFWKRRTRLRPQSVSLEALVAMARQMDDAEKKQSLAILLQQILDPLMDPQTIAGFQKIWPDNTATELQALLRKLRRGEEAEVRTAYICKNEIAWMALRPGIDVFFDAGLHDLEEAPIITCRELLTEADLRERESSEGWNKEFIEEACKHKGKTGLDASLDPLLLSPRGMGEARGQWGEDADERIEILRSFYYVHEKGTSALYQTVYHRHVPEHAALHELHGYEHGEMPFFPIRSEIAERPILESRGVPEICLTWQADAKNERDFYNDRFSMEILPTLQVPRGLAGQVLLGAGQQIERKRPGDYEFLGLPQMSSGLDINGRMREKEICEYFGRFHPEVDPAMTQMARQELVTDALTEIIPLIAQTFQLMQQYLTDDEIMAVVGPRAQGIKVGSKDIQGQFNFEFTFDVRQNDPEFLNTIVGLVKEIMPMDRMGTLDLSGLVGWLMHSVSPELAEQFVRPAPAAQMAEVDDELNQLARAAVGIESPLKEGSNPQLRLQVLQQVLQSPRFQQLVAGDQTGVVQKLLENQQAKYEFALTQQDNAQIGRVGVKPVLGGSGDGLPGPGAGLGMEGAAA